MNDFYDLNNFMAFATRKLKMVFIILCVCIIGFAGIRFVGGYKDYQAAKNRPVEKEQTDSSEEPMKRWAEIAINIGPNYDVVGEEAFNRSKEIAALYYSVRNSEDIMSEMYDKYFETAKEYGTQMRSLMSKYGYILDKEKNYDYVKYDFQRQFAVTTTENTVTIGFYSLNEEFSKEVVTAYEKLLTKKVEEQYPGFEHTDVSMSTRYELPEVSGGASATRVVSSGATSSASISMSTVIKQTIKGCVWGALIGLGISLAIIFLQYVMSRKVFLWSQLQLGNMQVYGLYYRTGCIPSQAAAAAVTEEVSFTAVPAKSPKPSFPRPSRPPRVGNRRAAATLNRKMTEMDWAISSSSAPMTGAVAAMAEPPQTDEPTPTRVEMLEGICSSLCRRKDTTREVVMVDRMMGRD